ncbi:MAG: SIMPL domain-containing protein [Burkholderiaceae bacterium]|jgi:hypothetical protein|nr:SIMPL domain-containing protein [Burkholderiaceae bacterium]
MQRSTAFIIGVFFVIGLYALGLGIKSGLEFQPDSTNHDGTITAEGFASKIVAASGILWSIEITSSGNSISDVLSKNEKDKEALKQFFMGAGVSESDMVFGDLQLINTKNGSDQYDTNTKGKDFIAEQSVTIQSADIKSVRKAQDKLSGLYALGVTLKYQHKSEFYSKYFYDTSNEQNQLIEEAFAKAKASAQKIAEQSNRTLGEAHDIYTENLDMDNQNTYLPGKQMLVRVRVTYNAK